MKSSDFVYVLSNKTGYIMFCLIKYARILHNAMHEIHVELKKHVTCTAPSHVTNSSVLLVHKVTNIPIKILYKQPLLLGTFSLLSAPQANSASYSQRDGN